MADPFADFSTAGGTVVNTTAEDSPDVQNAARVARQQAQMDAALQLEQQKAMLEQTRAQQSAAQTGRALAGQTAAGDAAQWAQDPAYANMSWPAAPPEARQHLMDAYSTLPGGGNGIAEQLPEIWNEAQRNATGNPNVGLENLQEGQTAQVKMGGVPVTVGKPPALHTDPQTGRFYKIDPDTGQPTYVQIQDPEGAQGPVGNPLTGDDYLQSISPEDAANIKAVAEGRTPLSVFSTKNNQRQRMAAMVQQYDPSADASTLTKRMATARDFSPAGKSGQAIRSGNTAIAHLNELIDTIPDLKNSGYEGWNDIANPIAKKWQSAGNGFNQGLGKFNTSAGAVSDELAKFFGGKGGMTVQEEKKWHDLLNPNAPPETLKSNISEAIQLLADQMKNYQTAYESTMGKEKTIPFINKETQPILDALDKKGVKTGSIRQIDSALPSATQPSTPPVTSPSATPSPAPQFASPEAVRDAYKAGTLPRAQAEQILKSQFGHQ